jgi:very-short-patch-repair endonuclease
MARKKKGNSDSKVDFLTEKGKEFAKDLRKKATQWELEFHKKLEQVKVAFVFQYPVICNKKNLFILDFYLPKHKLAIELDGAQHYTPSGQKYDKRRTSCLKKEGIQVIRFMNRQVADVTPQHIEELLKPYAVQSKNGI